MPTTSIHIPAADGYALQGTLHEPTGAPRAVVLIHPATAVPERLYVPFASYLVEQGFAAVTYDYRGIGRSAPKDLRGFKASMRDWMELDVAAATQWAQQRFPDQTLLAVGHSVGGHALGINDETGRLRAAALVASHAGYTGHIEQPLERWRVGLMMKRIGPAACRLLGYMPGARLGLGENLPSGVMLQWARWTRQPGYFFDDPDLQAERRFGEKQLPLLVLGFDDDPWARPHAIQALTRYFRRARVEHRQITPRDVGLRAIGHMGFFRRQSRDALWPCVSDWLSAQLAA